MPAIEALPLRLCRALLDVTAGTDGAISLGASLSQRSVLCSTSDYAARFEDAQDLTHQGPGIDAVRAGEPVVCLTRDDRSRRWPGLVGILPVARAGAVAAFPMRPAASVVGALTLHYSDPPTEISVPEVQFLVDTVGSAILGGLPADPSRDLVWIERDRVSQATGMVIAQLDLDPADALAVLRAHAFAQNATLLDVSQQVLDRVIDFSPPEPRP